MDTNNEINISLSFIAKWKYLTPCLTFCFTVNTNSSASVGSIADLDPVNDFYGSLACPPNTQYDNRMMPPPKQDMSKSGVS